MNIIGRRREIDELLALEESGKSELVALYGRRRVGKTYLIDELFKDKIIFKHTGLSNEETKNIQGTKMAAQLKAFQASLLLAGDTNPKHIKNWSEAFIRLIRFLESKNQNERMIVFLDEFPWMDTPKSDFIASFSWFWNNWGSTKSNLMLIICGSASSWIIDNLINAHGGLYNRLTYSIKISPLTLSDCKEYFESKNTNLPLYTIATIYMVFGGIPYYLNYYNVNYSLNENIDRLLVMKNAKLALEYDNLFTATFNEAKTSKSIIQFLSKKKEGFTRKEIVKGLGLTDGDYIAKSLKSLENSDFIIKYVPFNGNAKEKKYKIVDLFCLFYLKHINERKTLSETMFSENVDNRWLGSAFENLCYNHLNKIKDALGISQVETMQFSWPIPGDGNKKGAQIDLVIQRKDKVVHLCEMKFYQSEYINDEYSHANLINKINRLRESLSSKKSTQIIPTLITTFGLQKKEYWQDYSRVITLTDLFK